MTVLEFDDEATRRLLAVYVTPDVVEQRINFLNAFNPLPGERILDVGVGPGYLANSIAERVGISGSVCGIDISEPLLDVARSQSNDQYDIELRPGDATQLPYKDEEFDALVSTQVLEYVPDVDAAIKESYRVLRTGGRVALLDTDWDSIVWNCGDRGRMNRVLTGWENHAAHPFLPRTLRRRLESAGFEVEKEKIFPMFNPQFDPNTYSNRLIDLIVPFVVGQKGISPEEAEEWARDIRDCGRNGAYFFSLNRYFFLARKP